MKLLCRVFGHHWSIWSLNGAYAWCGWCGERRCLPGYTQSQAFEDEPSLAEIRAVILGAVPTIH